MNKFSKINLEQLLSDNLPKIAPIIPKFLIRRLEKILHVEEINSFLEPHYNDLPLEFVTNTIKFLNLSTTINNGESLKKAIDKRPIIVANHPLGGPESLLLIDEIGKLHSGVKMVSRKVLSDALKPLSPLLIPIPTIKDRNFVNSYKEAFYSDDPIIIFPAGYCSRPLSNGILFDLEWFNSFVKFARQYDRPILPIYIDGSNSKKFYRLSALRRFFKIKLSIESIYLPDEMFKQRGKLVALTVGSLIEPHLFVGINNNSLWSERIRSYVYLLSQSKEALFDPESPSILPLK